MHEKKIHAKPVADQLNAPLDLLLVKKIGMPFQEEDESSGKRCIA